MKSQRTLNGYILLYLPEHESAMTNKNWLGYVYEHIAVAEKRIGRRLRSDECVHHLDFDRSNNHPNNLIVMLQSEHRRLHEWLKNGAPISEKYRENGVNSGKPKVNRTTYCKVCNNPITTKGSKYYCSLDCMGLESRKVERPTKEQLAKDINNLSWTAIGKKYGVSDNATRKWARKYGLLGNPEPSTEYTQ